MAELAPEHFVAGSGGLAPDALQRGTRLGRYELLVPIAVGGMARVWAARLHGQRGFTKLVAVKTILPHLASDPEFERMLVDEARIASGVRHPNVCEIHELGEEREALYVVMEWVSGDALSNVIKANGAALALDPRVAARVIADACAGLHAAHNLLDEDGSPLQVVHRDVSPHNLLVSIDGNVKVTDFGVAKALNSAHQATAAGTLKGKIAYMAPEQASGGAVDRRSDVFALGCVLYEATTGKQPFRGDGEHAVMQELMKGAFMAPSRVVRGYPFELERIVTRAMSPQPLHRFPTMDQMRLALEEWLAKSGPVVTQSHVAAVVRERIGAEVEKRRERIRAASVAISDVTERDVNEAAHHATPTGPAASEASGVIPMGAAPAHGRASMPTMPPEYQGPPAMELASRAPSGLQYAMAAALGVLAAAALAGAGLWAWGAMQGSSAAHSPATASRAPEPAVAPRPAPSAAPAAAPPIAAPPIVFKVMPEQAYLVVDGSVQAVSVRSIARPKAGALAKVVIRADGFADETLTVDESAPSSVDVWLSPMKKIPAAHAADRGEHGGGEKADPGDKRDKPPEPLLPNPY